MTQGESILPADQKTTMSLPGSSSVQASASINPIDYIGQSFSYLKYLEDQLKKEADRSAREFFNSPEQQAARYDQDRLKDLRNNDLSKLNSQFEQTKKQEAARLADDQFKQFQAEQLAKKQEYMRTYVPATGGTFTERTFGIDKFVGGMEGARKDLEDITKQMNNAKSTSEYDDLRKQYDDKLNKYNTIANTDFRLFKDTDEVKINQGAKYAAGYGVGGKMKASEWGTLGNRLSNLKQQLAGQVGNESVIGKMIEGINQSGGRATSGQLGDLASEAQRADTTKREINMLTALGAYKDKPSDESYSKFANAFIALKSQPDYTKGIDMAALKIAAEAPATRSLSSVEMGTPLFKNTESKEAVEKALANPNLTNREKSYWLNQADQIRENAIHSSSEYHHYTKDIGEALNIPMPMNPYDILGDVALRQQQITRGITPAEKSFTQLPKTTDYLGALSSNQAEFNRQIKQNGIGAYGYMPDGTPKSLLVAQAYSGPAGGRFIPPSEVLPDVPITDYSKWLKTITPGNLDERVVPEKSTNVSGFSFNQPSVGIAPPKTSSGTTKSGFGGFLSSMLGFLPVMGLTETMTMDKKGSVAATPAAPTEQKLKAPFRSDFALPAFDKMVDKKLTDYEDNLKKYEAGGSTDPVMYNQLLKDEQEVKSLIDIQNAKNELLVNPPPKEEPRALSVFGTISDFTKAFGDLKKGDVGGLYENYQQGVSRFSTRLAPDLTGISKDPLARGVVSTMIMPLGSRENKEIMADLVMPFGESMYKSTRERPIEDVALYHLPALFSGGSYALRSGVAKLARSENTLAKGTGGILSSNAVQDVSTLAKLTLGGAYAGSSILNIMGDEKSDKSLAGYSSRSGQTGKELALMYAGLPNVGIRPGIDNPLTPKTPSTLEKARIFASSRLNTIGMSKGQKAAYLAEIDPYLKTRFIEPYETKIEPKIEDLTNVKSGQAGPIKEAMTETPSAMFGSGTMQAQKSPFPTGEKLRIGKDADLWTSVSDFMGNLASKFKGGRTKASSSPHAEAGELYDNFGRKVPVDPHNFPQEYPDLPGRTYGGTSGSYGENVQGLGSRLFGEPVRSLPRPSEMTIKGQKGYEGDINFEHLNVQSAKKSAAVQADLQDPMNKGYRLNKDLYDSHTIKADLIATERARGVSPAREKELLKVEKDLARQLKQEITYKNEDGKVVTEKLGDIFNREAFKVQSGATQPVLPQSTAGYYRGSLSGSSFVSSMGLGAPSIKSKPSTKSSQFTSNLKNIYKSLETASKPSKPAASTKAPSVSTKSPSIMTKYSLPSLPSPSKAMSPRPSIRLSDPGSPSLRGPSPTKLPSPSITGSPSPGTPSFKSPKYDMSYIYNPPSSPKSPGPSSPSSPPSSPMYSHSQITPPIGGVPWLAPPGSGGGSGGGRGHADVIVRNPVQRLVVASSLTGYKVQKAFRMAPIKFAQKPQGRGNAAPTIKTFSTPKMSKTTSKQSPKVNFGKNISDMFGSKKKKGRGGMLF